MGLGRLLYAARVMDGESVPIWLNFGVGKGLLCSPRLSWVSRFIAARFPLGCKAARGSPSRCCPACPALPSHGLKLEVHLFCTWPQRKNSDSAKQIHGYFQEKEQGVLTSLCYKGQVPT